MKKIKPIEKCRSCGSDKLIPIISLGKHYVSNFVNSKEEQGIKIPLELVLCNQCKLLQLKYSAPDESMWNEQYWYKSGINSIIRNNLKDIVKKSEEFVELKDNDIIIDVGCNDGTMFGYYKNKNLNLVGFEPCHNVAEEAKEKGYHVVPNFFNAEVFKIEHGNKKAKLITAISVFYDLEDPNKFLEDIKECLDKDGLFIIQQNYLVSMLENNAFDNICFEHRAYYSFDSLKILLEKHGLEIFDVELNNINGGSFLTYIKFKENKTLSILGSEVRIAQIKEKERNMKLDILEPYQSFAIRIEKIKNDILEFLVRERIKGKTIGIVGASTRGNTLLQYFGLTPKLIIAAADANKDKWGKKTVGTLIPVVSIDEMKKINPDYQLVIIHHLFEGLRDKEKDFLKRGGKFILPLPEFKIVSRMDI